MRKSECG